MSHPLTANADAALATADAALARRQDLEAGLGRILLGAMTKKLGAAEAERWAETLLTPQIAFGPEADEVRKSVQQLTRNVQGLAPRGGR